MPTLGGLRADLPLSREYRRLGTASDGPEAQLVLLAVAGEIGYQRMLASWGVLAEHTALDAAQVRAAVDRLVAADWLGLDDTRHATEGAPAAVAPVLWVKAERHATIFRTLTAHIGR